MKLFRGRTFRRYVLSYLSVAIVISLVMGMAMTWVSSRWLRQSEEALYRSRLYLTADYIERQIKAMQDIQVEIKANLVYQPFYLKQNIIHELELLSAFSRFSSYTPWAGEYYLWYIDEEKIFGTHGSYTPGILFQYHFNGITPEALNPFLSPAGSIWMRVLPEKPDSLLICLPFHFGSSKKAEGKAALLFLVPLSDVRGRVYEMTGASPGEAFSLIYNGQQILDGPAQEASLSAAGPEEKVTLRMSLAGFPQFARINAFSKLMLIIALAVLLAGAVVALSAAWHSYQPIRRMYKKYYVEGANPSDSELNSIEHLLDSALEINSFSQKQLEQQVERIAEQQAWLKQQLVMMLISGNTSSVVQQQIARIGFEISHGQFAVLFLHTTKGQPDESLLPDIEAFSGEEYSLYTAELRRGEEYAILINFEEDEQLHVLLELLTDALTARGMQATVQLSRSCSALGDIVSVAMEALNSRPQPMPAENERDETPKGDMLQQVIGLAEEGQVQQALTLLDTLISTTENQYPSYLMKICTLNVYQSRLFQRVGQIGAISAQQRDALSMQDPVLIAQHMRELVRGIAMSTLSASETESPGAEVVNYIQEHYLDSDISLSSTAQALGVSTRQVTHLLRISIDMSFKEYLLKLRMEHAKELLSDSELSIAKIATIVGYFNTSHFIKCFKTYSGLTPGEWKKNVCKK